MVEIVQNEGVAGPHPTLVELLTKHEKLIRRFLGRRSGPYVLRRTTLDDLFQETVAVAIRRSALFEYRDEATFLTWVNAIARNVVLRSLADQRRRLQPTRIKGVASTGVGVRETEISSASRTPSSMVAGRESRWALDCAISKLPEHYRRVIALYKLEGRSLDEVAQQMDRSKNATCRLIARAMQRLRTLLPGE